MNKIPPRKRKLWPHVLDFKSNLKKTTKKVKQDKSTFLDRRFFFGYKDEKKIESKNYFNNSFSDLKTETSNLIDSDKSESSSEENNKNEFFKIHDEDSDNENPVKTLNHSKKNNKEQSSKNFECLPKLSKENKNSEENSMHISESDTQWSELQIENYDDIEENPTSIDCTTTAVDVTSTSFSNITTPGKTFTQFNENNCDSGKKKKIKFIKGGLAEKLHLLLEKQKRDKLFNYHKSKIMNEQFNEAATTNETNRCLLKCTVSSTGFSENHLVFYDCQLTNHAEINITKTDFIGGNKEKDNGNKCDMKKLSLLMSKDVSNNLKIGVSSRLTIHPPWFALPMPDGEYPVLFGMEVTSD